MANLLLRIFLAVSFVILVIAVIGSLLPRDFQTSTSVVIQATPEQVFPYVSDLQRWQSWSPWNAHDNSQLTVELGASTTGVGATQTWSEPRGEGKLWITAVDPPGSIGFSSRFSNWPQMDSSIDLHAEGNATRVTWRSAGSMPGGPFYGWLGMMFSSSLDEEYNKSLQRLRATVDRNLANAPSRSDG